MTGQPETLLICCGALAREVVSIVRENGWNTMRVQCLPAALHADPERIVSEVRLKIHENRERFDRLLVLYSDCGTGGGLQRMLDEEGVEGIGGAHCYEVFAGGAFREVIEDEPGCFFVTDFLARNFDRLVFRGLGLDRFPKLRETYFGNYTKLVYLAQTRDPELQAKAEAAAESIGLAFELRYTAHGGYESFLRARREGHGGATFLTAGHPRRVRPVDDRVARESTRLTTSLESRSMASSTPASGGSSVAPATQRVEEDRRDG